MAERSKAIDCKSIRHLSYVGSNPTRPIIKQIKCYIIAIALKMLNKINTVKNN